MSTKSELTKLLDEHGFNYVIEQSARGHLFVITVADGTKRYIETWNSGGFRMWSSRFTPECAISALLNSVEGD